MWAVCNYDSEIQKYFYVGDISKLVDFRVTKFFVSNNFTGEVQISVDCGILWVVYPSSKND